MKKLAVIVLAVIGAASLLVGLGLAVFIFGFDSGSDYKIERKLVSPDGKYTATLYTTMGGGAAGWCSQVISVNTDAEPFLVEVEKTSGVYQVFRANCSANIEMHWLTDTRLRIDFSAGVGSGGLSIYMEETDKSEVVQIEYRMAPNKSPNRDAQ